MIKPPQVPFFIKPYQDESGGVDFLGIRQVNLDLMDKFLPSINNVTVHIRPYALMTWIAWAFREEMLAKGQEDASQGDFKRFREKLEVLYGWSHQIHQAGTGMPGNAQQRPEGVKKVPLSFEAWNRNVSWLDAVNYGPSLKTDNGMGLLDQLIQQDESGGVDFLGIRQVNLDLMDKFLPSINNVTVHIRPYALMTWIAWAFREEMLAKGQEDASQGDFKRFREKLEVLYGWSHQIHQAGTGMPGNAQQRPEGVKKVPLSFEAWNRNVSWLDAVNYGPSLKTDNGMGLLDQLIQGVFTVTRAGEALAEAFDKSLRKYDEYAAVRSVDSYSASETAADALYPFWMISRPSKMEVEVFRKVFYRPEKAGKRNRIGRRSASISLILYMLTQQKGPASVDQLRRSMALDDLPSKLNGYSQEVLAEVQGIWRVLQVRQAQRLAAEAIFGWIEVQIIDKARNLSSQIVDDFVKIIETEEKAKPLAKSWVGDSLSRLSDVKGKTQSYLKAATTNSEINVFDQMDAISQSLSDDRDHSAYLGLKLLLVCAAIAKELEQDDYCQLYLSNGSAARISLMHWSYFVFENAKHDTKVFLLDMVENYFLSQHFGIAAARYSEGKQRLRITIEEGGLVSMLGSLNKAWHPNVARDRLATVISLMADCRLVHRKIVDGEDFYSI